MPTLLLPNLGFLAVLALAAIVARRVAPRGVGAVTRLLGHRWAPVVAGIIAGGLVWAIWGGLAQPPLYHDEKAYVLQAELFAHWHWAAPPRPLPDFFAQAHVLVAPALASKYPPGHSLVMVPGVWLGMPGLMIVLLTALTGGLLFSLARRVANGWVALAAWVLWTGAPNNFTWRAAYFSETTTSAALILALWALWEWRLHRRTRWLATVAVMVALIGITRPLTGIALAVPITVIVLRDAVRLRVWVPLAVSLAVSLPVAGLVPVWDARTMGDWRVTPHGAYTRDYMPYDHLGFGFDSTPPRRAVPDDIARLNDFYRAIHERHTLAALPRTMLDRVVGLGGGMYGLWWPVLLPITLLALWSLSGEMRFAAWVVGAQLGAYALYAHPPQWTLYYLEIYPILAALGAIGLWRLLDAIEHGAARALAMRPDPAPDVQRAFGALVVTLVLAWPTTIAVLAAAQGRVKRQAHFRRFDGVLEGMPPGRAILFVHYMPTHDEHISFVGNAPDPDTARVWTVYDRGDDDARLMRLFPGRKAWRYDEASQVATPLFLTDRAAPLLAPPGDGGRSR